MAFITDADASALAANWSRRSVFFRLATDPKLLYWSGFGEIVSEMRDVAVSDETYIGGGKLGNIEGLAQFVNGQADRLDFVVSGLDDNAVQKLDAAAPPVAGASLHIGILAFDAAWQPATSLIPVAALTADYVKISISTAKQGQPASALITLSAHYGDVMAHTRPKATYYTPPHQRLIDPDDKAFSRVSLYQQNYRVAWPVF